MGLLKVWLVMALVLLPNLVNSEMAVFGVAELVLPNFTVGIVMAAIMSTADARAGAISSPPPAHRSSPTACSLP